MLKQDFERALLKLVKIIGVLVSTLGSVISINRSYPETVLFLVIETGIIIWLLGELLDAKEKLKQKEENEEIDIFRAFFNSVNFKDKTHRLRRITKNVKVIGKDAQVDLILEGINDSEEASEAVTIKIGGDNGLDLEALNCLVFDLMDPDDSGRRPKLLSSDENGQAKKIKLLFTSCIQPKHDFKIRCSYIWPGSMGRDKEYIIYFVTPFKEGVEEISSRIEFEPLPKYVTLKYWDSNEKRFRIDSEKPVKEKTESGETYYKWSKKNPTNDYMLIFERDLKEYDKRKKKEE